MGLKIIKEIGENGVVLREGVNHPYALISLNTVKEIVTSLQDTQSHVSKINDKEAAVAIELLRDKLRPILDGIEDMAKELGVEIQLENREFDYELAQKELEEAIAQLRAISGPDDPNVA